MTTPATAPTVVLTAQGVCKRFGRVEALQDLDLTLRAGEWLGLLGPNGAGKTTLMMILAGLLPADRGRFTLLGEPVEPARSGLVRSSLGLVPQEIALYPALTAEENLRVFARFHRVARGQESERVSWALGWTGLADRARDRVATFSGGMRRRLNIACAVLHQPKVVLLDEPTVGVDPQARQRIWTMLRELRKDGTALVHSSHQLDEVESTCDRVLIIDHGRKIGAGSVADLLGTMGQRPRMLTMRFCSPPALDAFGPSFEVLGPQVRGAVTDPARDLLGLLRTAEAQGLVLLDIQVEAPRLEDLFTEVTGKELRE